MSIRPTWLVILGVSGSGKSTLGQAIASGAGLPFIEGDDFHSPHSVAKMRDGIPLSDEDRSAWLDQLGQQLRLHEHGAVLSCSGLKRSYRNRLSAAVDHLKFVYLQIDLTDARMRVAARTDHLFPVSLVDNQFAVLEPPVAGPDVLVLPAMQPTSVSCMHALHWIQQ